MATANLTQPTSAANGNIPYVGTTANDNTGSPLRDAFSRINSRLTEIYGSQDGSNVVQTPFVDGDNIKGGTINESHLSVTNSPTDGYVLTYDNTSGGFTWEQKFDGDITGIVAGAGLTGDASSGEATLAVGAGTGITVNADDIQISDNGVDHQQLSARYTDKQDIATTSGTINLDASLYATFELTGNLTTATLNIQNMKKGTVIDILLSGADLSGAVITLSDDFTTSQINKVGSTSLDTTKKNIIQVLCADDLDSDAILNYAIASYETDTTP